MAPALTSSSIFFVFFIHFKFQSNAHRRLKSFMNILLIFNWNVVNTVAFYLIITLFFPHFLLLSFIHGNKNPSVFEYCFLAGVWNNNIFSLLLFCMLADFHSNNNLFFSTKREDSTFKLTKWMIGETSGRIGGSYRICWQCRKTLHEIHTFVPRKEWTLGQYMKFLWFVCMYMCTIGPVRQLCPSKIHALIVILFKIFV